MTDTNYESAIREHYRKQAEEFGHDPASTMLDQTTRQAEVEAISKSLAFAVPSAEPLRLLEVGCGNGYLLQALRRQFPAFHLNGIDFSREMINLAHERGIVNCAVSEGDVRALSFHAQQFDIVVSERCVINLLDQTAQDRAFLELHRVLKTGGYLLLIEAFTDGLENLNRARTELGLPENHIPDHNLWLDKPHITNLLVPLFEPLNSHEPGDDVLPPVNFLSTHYFMSRVLYPATTKREILYNTEFVRFFAFLPPHGNYSPIQFLFLRKRG